MIRVFVLAILLAGCGGKKASTTPTSGSGSASVADPAPANGSGDAPSTEEIPAEDPCAVPPPQ